MTMSSTRLPAFLQTMSSVAHSRMALVYGDRPRAGRRRDWLVGC